MHNEKIIFLMSNFPLTSTLHEKITKKRSEDQDQSRNKVWQENVPLISEPKKE